MSSLIESLLMLRRELASYTTYREAELKVSVCWRTSRLMRRVQNVAVPENSPIPGSQSEKGVMTLIRFDHNSTLCNVSKEKKYPTPYPFPFALKPERERRGKKRKEKNRETRLKVKSYYSHFHCSAILQNTNSRDLDQKSWNEESYQRNFKIC